MQMQIISDSAVESTYELHARNVTFPECSENIFTGVKDVTSQRS